MLWGAQKEGFEPSLGSTPTTPLAGEPLRPLGYFCRSNDRRSEIVWRREWDSNPRPFRVTGFQDRLLKPLGHLSKAALKRMRYTSRFPGRCQGEIFRNLQENSDKSEKNRYFGCRPVYARAAAPNWKANRSTVSTAGTVRVSSPLRVMSSVYAPPREAMKAVSSTTGRD